MLLSLSRIVRRPLPTPENPATLHGDCMLYSTARVLQFIGLVILPVAISGNVAGSLTLSQSLTLSSVGLGIFIVGWLLQQVTRPK